MLLLKFCTFFNNYLNVLPLQLRLCISLVNFLLKSIRRYILEFPMEMLLRWCMGNFYDTGN